MIFLDIDSFLVYFFHRILIWHFLEKWKGKKLFNCKVINSVWNIEEMLTFIFLSFRTIIIVIYGRIVMKRAQYMWNLVWNTFYSCYFFPILWEVTVDDRLRCNLLSACDASFRPTLPAIVSIETRQTFGLIQKYYLTLYGPNSVFSTFFGTKPKIGSFRLPTHRSDAHRKFFDDPFLK